MIALICQSTLTGESTSSLSDSRRPMYVCWEVGSGPLRCWCQSVGQHGCCLFHQITPPHFRVSLPESQRPKVDRKSVVIQIYPNDGFIRQLKLYALEHHRSRSRASSANRSLSWSRRFDRDAYSPPKKVNRQNEVSLTPDKTAKHAGYFNSDKYEYRYFAPQTSYKEEPIHASGRPESRTFYSKSMAKPKKYEEM